jgi:hypothetical protein
MKNKCKHDWCKMIEACRENPSIYKCNKCNEQMYFSEVLQSQEIKNLKKHRMATLFISISAIIISILTLILKQCEK